ncbi:hypothetical protein [Roseicyclus elongatus]|uniref:hypothetical protein n=1 Tax=Roseicyclus elongatus TaxID=159346 RepID=UPI00046CA6AA|nr:hypothetical protein [Roseibacterium elongatum]
MMTRSLSLVFVLALAGCGGGGLGGGLFGGGDGGGLFGRGEDEAPVAVGPAAVDRPPARWPPVPPATRPAMASSAA